MNYRLGASLGVCIAACAVDSSPLWAAMTTGGIPIDALGREQAAGVIGLLGRLHPLVVHFPIALIITACVAEVFFVRTRKESFAFAARFMLYAGSLFAFVAVLLGIAAAAGRAANPTEIDTGVGVHGALGMITAGLVALTAGLAAGAARQADPWKTLLYRLMLAAAVITVILTAHTGATLVFGPRYFFVF